MADKIPNLDQIPNVRGYMVLDEDQIITVHNCKKFNFIFYFLINILKFRALVIWRTMMK